jgi:PIN domain nuclease of toxin-antitoxin system
MKLLMDTHAFLWFVWDHKNLSSTAKALIADPLNDVYFSAASHWETKASTGKLTLNAPFSTLIEQPLSKKRLQAVADRN